MISINKQRWDEEIERENLTPRNTSSSRYNKIKREYGQHNMQYERDARNENFTEDLVDEKTLIEELRYAILQLEEKLHKIQSQNDEWAIQSIRMQNEQGRKDLEKLCEIDEDETYDLKKLEGILADYSDSRSSVEWVRSIRDDN